MGRFGAGLLYGLEHSLRLIACNLAQWVRLYYKARYIRCTSPGPAQQLTCESANKAVLFFLLV